MDFGRFPVAPGEQVLDLGCGAGRHAFELYRRGARVVAFDRDENGQLVNVNGYPVQPGITIPSDANGLQVSADGIVQAYIGTSSTPTQLGQLQLFRFANKEGLQSAGENNFLETAASGPAQAGTPNSEGMGKVMQGYLEEANVNPVTEIADLIAAQRAYEMNARVVTGADEMLQSISQMR